MPFHIIWVSFFELKSLSKTSQDHLKIAQRLNDLVGESRAYWALGNAHKSLGNKDRAAFYTREHLKLRYDYVQKYLNNKIIKVVIWATKTE